MLVILTLWVVLVFVLIGIGAFILCLWCVDFCFCPDHPNCMYGHGGHDWIFFVHVGIIILVMPFALWGLGAILKLILPL